MAADGAGGRLRLRARIAPVRVRTTLIAATTVAAALIAGAVAMSAVQSNALLTSVDDSLRVRARDLGASLAEGSLPTVVGVRDHEDAVVQIVADDGTVIAASANAGAAPLLPAGFAPGDVEVLRTVETLSIDDAPFRVIARTVDSVAGPATIYVAEAIDDQRESVALLNRTLTVAVPLFTLLVGGLTWLVVGRALAPVEAIRAEVGAIGARDLGRRVPEPNVDDEIGRLARTMNGMLERIESAHERQRRFVADASHELRAPLTAMRAQLEVDLAASDEGRRVETEQAVLEETVALQRLVDDLLTLASNDDGSPLRLATVDLDDVVLAEIRRARESAALLGIQIDAGGVSGAQLTGDRDQLRRAVRNLLENAVRHARARVAVSLVENDTGVTLVVDDDGPGIPAGARERVFERFTRLDEARSRDDGGTGLGLAIARDIVERHGGAIRAEAANPAGARFVVTLPLPDHGRL